MRAISISSLLLCLLLPALAVAAPANTPPSAVTVTVPVPSSPDEAAGDTADDNAPAPAPSAPTTQPGKTAAEPVAGPIAPEQYFQLLLERQQLGIDYYREVNKALDQHAKDQTAALKAVAALEAERRKRAAALFEKYKIDPAEYYLSVVGTPAQAQRSKYLDAHPELRDQISANSKDLKVLEDQTTERLLQIVSRPTPPPPKKPKS